MGRGLYRTQILLEPEQHEALVKIAKQENRSVSDLVRELVEHYVAERSAEARKAQVRQTLAELKQFREAMAERYGVYEGDLVAEVRAEREADFDRIQREWQEWQEKRSENK